MWLASAALAAFVAGSGSVTALPDPSSIVGSIGVISSSFGFVEAISKLGVQRRLYTAGQNKSVLDPFLPEKKEDVARLKKLQLEIHDVFINLVKQSRGDRLSDHKDIFTGLFWTGEAGRELGLIDEIGDIRGGLKRRYGEKTKMKVIEAKKSIFGRKLGVGITLPGSLDMNALAASAADGIISAADERALWSRFGL